MASTIKINALCAAFALCACAIANPASAGVFDFTGGNPIYDANRSTTVQDSGYHYDENLALISGPDKVGATVGFNWSNADYGTTEAPYWMYSWDGINVSNCSDLSVDVDKYIDPGEKASYTSITGTDADGVAGGYYGVFYGNQHAGSGLSDSDAGMIMFNEAVEITGISVANTMVTYDYFLKTFTDDEDFHTQEVRVYGITTEAEHTNDYVSIMLSDLDGVADGWISADLTELNGVDGLLGLYFELWTDDYNQYGALAHAYFAFDNITYNMIVPEPAHFAALFGALMLGFAFIRRRSAK